MARIRTIKPEFWTSEAVAALDIGSRLTFIGLWSYADDNGVAIFNERLIASSIYPMDDPHEALARVREALARLSAGGQIVLYRASGRRLLYLTGWDEHQKVDHPKNPRYPRPEDGPHEPLTCDDTDTNHSSRDLREDVEKISRWNREQGAGNREQGKPAVALVTQVTTARDDEDQNAHAADLATITPSPARLAETAVRALVPTSISRRSRDELRRHAETLIRDGTPGEVITAALSRWMARSGARAGLLPFLVDDEVRERANATAQRAGPGRLSVGDQRAHDAAAALARIEARRAAGEPLLRAVEVG